MHLHRVDEHARQTERDFLGEFFARHRHLEAVAKVDVHDLAADATEHQVRRMPVAETKDITDHRHHRKRSRVVGSPVEPHLTTDEVDQTTVPTIIVIVIIVVVITVIIIVIVIIVVVTIVIIIIITNDHHESAFLLQRLPILLQRYNAVAVMGTITHTTPEDEM